MLHRHTRQKFFLLPSLLVAGSALFMASSSAQTVRWEDYRGNQHVAPDAQYTGAAGLPRFDNNPGVNGIANLRPLAANPNNAVRTGSSSQIDFLLNQTDSLCNDETAFGGDLNSTSCRLQAQGKVIYALLSFPVAGTYSIAAAHDDNLAVELSPDYANTNYHSANYTILAGSVGAWTANDTTYETFGTFTAANPGSCALLRMFWINQGGQNFDRLQWTPPGGPAVLVPASAFRDPADPTSATGCNGSITGNNTVITLKKNVGGRAAGADQFTVQIASAATGGTVHSAASTTGTGTGVQATAGPFNAVTGSTYYLRDMKTAGNLGSYNATIACTRNGVAFTPSLVGAGVGSTANPVRWSVTTAANDNIDCTITNIPQATAPTVRIEKITSEGIGTFGFSGSNGVGSPSISTIVANTPASSPNYTLTTAGQATTITENAPPLGYTLASINCTGLGTGTATPNIATRTVTLNAAATANGNAIACTFTNRKLKANIGISKSNSTTSVQSGSNTTYTITVSNTGPDSASNTVVQDPAVTGLSCTAVTCPPAGLTGGATCPATLTIPALQGTGLTIPTLPSGGSVQLEVACSVTATGV